ncbi:MAG: PorV/PorQ family protein, partial [bacterium]|nr:PorV/PorQ family protein [bacterium]
MFILFTLLYAASIHSQAGTTSASFLKIAPTAKIASLAEAFYSVTSDIGILLTNPASLKYVDEIVGFTHNEYIENMKYNYIGYIRNGLGFGAAGLFIPNELERRTQTTENINVLTQPEGFFGGRSTTLFIAKSIMLNDVALGSTLKIIEETIDNKTAFGLSVDLGMLIKKGNNNYAIGIQNFGPAIRFMEKAYNLPLVVKMGYSKVYKNTLIASELNIPFDNYPKIAVGFEYIPLKFFALRAGYKYRYHGQELDGLSGVAAGAGFKIKNFIIDYAFQPFGELGSSHKFTISYNFNIKEETTQKINDNFKKTLIIYSTYTVLIAEP